MVINHPKLKVLADNLHCDEDKWSLCNMQIPKGYSTETAVFIVKCLTLPFSVGYRCVWSNSRIKFEMSRWGHGFWGTSPVWSSVVLALTYLIYRKYHKEMLFETLHWEKCSGQRFTRSYNLFWSRLQTWCLRNALRCKVWEFMSM